MEFALPLIMAFGIGIVLGYLYGSLSAITCELKASRDPITKHATALLFLELKEALLRCADLSEKLADYMESPYEEDPDG